MTVSLLTRIMSVCVRDIVPGRNSNQHFVSFSVRKRHREERIASTSQKVQQMKQRLNDSERKRENWLYWRPILLNVGAGAAVAVGLLLCWMYSQ